MFSHLLAPEGDDIEDVTCVLTVNMFWMQWELGHATESAAQYQAQMDVTFTCFHAATTQARKLRQELNELEDKVWQASLASSDGKVLLMP